MKKNILLLHGWGASVKKLEALRNHLQLSGWNAHTLKLPAFDLDTPKEVWGISEYSKYVLNEAEKIFGDEKYYLFGHSFGGRLSIRIGSKNLNQIQGLVLCSSAGISRGNSLKRVIFGSLAKIGKSVLPTQFANTGRKLLYKAARTHDYEKIDGIKKQIFIHVVNDIQKEEAKLIKTPTLILWGKNDQMTPIKDAYYLNSNIKNSQLEIFPEGKHSLPYDNPDWIIENIEKWFKLL